MDAQTIARFWAKVDRRGPDECWEWTASLVSGHYGAFSVRRVPITAHRFSWQLAHGRIPDGLVVRHRCDNRPCVNPAHLILGTPWQNRQDWVARGCKPAPPSPTPRVRIEDDPRSRFWAKVATGAPGACWPWKSGRHKAGYGQFSLNGQNCLAHRVAFLFSHGRWPTSCILHTCDNPPCCNPSHFEEGTKVDNARDRDAKGRTARGDRTPHHRRARGARHGRTRLDEAAVTRMRARYGEGWLLRELAAAYGLGTSQVWRIVQRSHWRHVK